MLQKPLQTNQYVLYKGLRKDIKNKVGILGVTYEDKLLNPRWTFTPIEGVDRFPILINPTNISFLTSEELERMKLKTSFTNVRANLRKVELNEQLRAKSR